jgi:hypothetical protein
MGCLLSGLPKDGSGNVLTGADHNAFNPLRPTSGFVSEQPWCPVQHPTAVIVKEKVNVKLPLSLTKHYAMKTYGRTDV